MNATAALLAFDTSTEVLAVAASGPKGQSLSNLPGGAAASAQLLPQIESALGLAGLALGDLSAIAFGRGPGAFTGLRTSCAVAQGLAFGLGRPVLLLDSLMVVAEDALTSLRGRSAIEQPATAVSVAVAMDARMDEIYGAVYQRDACGVGEASDSRGGPGEDAARPWLTLHEPALFTLDAWNAVLEARAGSLHVVAGSALAAFGTRLHHVAGADCRPAEQDRAAALLRLAQQAWAAGAAIDAAQALPTYLRDKVALTAREREDARAREDARPSSAPAPTPAKKGAARAGVAR